MVPKAQAAAKGPVVRVTLSQGADFISRLDLPYDIKLALGSAGTAALGDWISDHRRDVLDAMERAGILTCTDYLRRYYGVAEQPCRHQWRITKVYSGSVTLTAFWCCAVCGAETSTCTTPEPPEVPDAL